MDIIWKNQNPPDCSKAKYLLSDNWHQGFGSEVHVLGVGLAIAVSLGRVYLQSPNDQKLWRINTEYCKNHPNGVRRNTECYYEPWSKCTIDDAYRAHISSLELHSEPKPPAAVAFWNLTRYDFLDRHHDPVWTPAEDALLVSKLEEFGVNGAWHMIRSRFFPQRNSLSLFYRWKYHLQGRWMRDNDVHRFMRQHHNFTAAQHALSREAIAAHHQLTMRMRQHGNDRVRDVVTPYGVLSLPALARLGVSVELGTVSLPFNMSFETPLFALTVSPMLHERKFVPDNFSAILRCAPIPVAKRHFWWRAVAAAFLLRPNQYTLRTIEKYASPIIAQAQGQCVATYVRHGDKGFEMQLMPFERYAKVAEEVWRRPQKYFSQDNATNRKSMPRIFYVGSEDIQVFEDAKLWAIRAQRLASEQPGAFGAHSITLVHHNLTQSVLFHRQPKQMHATGGRIHDLEYLSYLINVAEISRCEVLVCTYLSNFCRVLDELRATVGAKAHSYVADVNAEICRREDGLCIERHNLISKELLQLDASIDGRIW